MPTKFKVYLRYSFGTIEVVEIVKETPKKIWYLDVASNPRNPPQSQNKNSDYFFFCDTIKQAKSALLIKARSQVTRATSNLKDAQRDLKKIEAIKT